MKRALITSTIIALLLIVGVQAHTLASTSILDVVQSDPACTDEEITTRILSMNENELNGVMFSVAQSLTEQVKVENQEQFEQEFTAYANREAISHMNEVVGVLTKSIGDLPE